VFVINLQWECCSKWLRDMKAIKCNPTPNCFLLEVLIVLWEESSYYGMRLVMFNLMLARNVYLQVVCVYCVCHGGMVLSCDKQA
jgi:hypothetical protein